MDKDLIIGITGASGAVYGITLLKMLRSVPDIKTHLVITKAGEMTSKVELSMGLEDIKYYADFYHPIKNVGACIASGSFRAAGMIIAPCSMNSLGEIAHSISSNLLTRSADVMLKERRPLILMVRDTPFHLGHLRNMVSVTEMGGIIAPPIPAFYTYPDTIEQMVIQQCARILDTLGIETPDLKRWQGL